MNISNYFTAGPQLEVRREDLPDGHKTWWATCPGCPGWTAAADSWEDLFTLVSEAHQLPDVPHRDWTMIAPPELPHRSEPLP